MAGDLLTTLGTILFYIGLFGFFAGIIGLFRGEIEILKVRTRKDALKLIGIAFLLVMTGSLVVGRQLWIQ